MESEDLSGPDVGTGALSGLERRDRGPLCARIGSEALPGPDAGTAAFLGLDVFSLGQALWHGSRTTAILGCVTPYGYSSSVVVGLGSPSLVELNFGSAQIGDGELGSGSGVNWRDHPRNRQ